MDKLMRYSLKIKVNEVDTDEFEYIAQYDQFPTIIGVGDTPEEALAEARIFLKEYLDYCDNEGIKIKEAESDSWKENFSGKITLRLPKSLHRDLSNYAEDDGMSINSIVNDAIRAYLFEQSMEKVADHVFRTISDHMSGLNGTRFDTPLNEYPFPKNTFLN
jgi:predicted HicB family RNase H-like nuclease